ncbi:MAG: thiolase C-terminal domain-containing protein, partial [Myxococcota bacterium]
MSGQRTDWGRGVPYDPIAGKVAIVGVGEAEHSKASGRSAREIAGQAIERAIEDAGLLPEEIDGITFSRGIAPFDAKCFHERFGTSHAMFESGNGGGMAWAATAPAVATPALPSGRARHVVNVFAVSMATDRDAMTGGPGHFHAAEEMKRNLEIPYGWFPQPVYFATIARRHMIEYGTRPEQLGAIAVACRRHANLHPCAVMRERKLALADYLASPMLVDPLRMEDCCLISDGGAAYVMTTPERARDLRKPPVHAIGVGEGHSDAGLYWAQQGDFTATPQVFSAPAAFEMAGIAPADVDVLTLYDPFTIVALMQIEDMGFCEKGGGGAFVEGSTLHHDGGVLPYNTHGGLLSHAYVLGISHVVETVRQLRGEAAAQVPGATVGVYGGYTGAMASTLV